MSSHPLEKIASVLEASADYIDALEKTAAAQAEKENAQREEEITTKAAALAEKYRRATGDDAATDEVFKKIAANDDEDLKKIFNKLASFEEADALGAPRSTKVASVPDGDEAGARLVSWALS